MLDALETGPRLGSTRDVGVASLSMSTARNHRPRSGRDRLTRADSARRLARHLRASAGARRLVGQSPHRARGEIAGEAGPDQPCGAPAARLDGARRAAHPGRGNTRQVAQQSGFDRGPPGGCASYSAAWGSKATARRRCSGKSRHSSALKLRRHAPASADRSTSQQVGESHARVHLATP